MFEFQTRLINQMNSQRTAGESTGSDVEDLTVAYDYLQKNLNENSDSSQKHAKFLNDAFANLVHMAFVQDTGISHHKNGEDLANNLLRDDIGMDEVVLRKNILDEAEKNAPIFADSFLKNYKKHGLEAYNIAMSSL